LTKKHSDLLSRFEEIARNRYTVGKGLQQDVLKAQLEASTPAALVTNAGASVQLTGDVDKDGKIITVTKVAPAGK
jgi:hypothetical protein